MPDIGPVQRALDAALGPDKIRGIAAAVAPREGVIFEGAAGQRSAGSPAPMTADYVFGIASMTKAITGAAAMQLVERGKLALDMPAQEVVPEIAKKEVLVSIGADGTV